MWAGELKFGATSGETAIVLDGDHAAGPSPMQALGGALAGCVASDVVMIRTKGRHGLRALRVSCAGERAASPPKRFTRVLMTFHVTGDVPAAAVERAIALSRDSYCSVFHTLRPDLEVTTSFEIQA